MKNLLTAIIFALVVGLLPVNAYAADGKYKGLKIIKILIEKLESNEKKCNFTKDTIKTTASFPIVTGTKLKIKKNSQMYFYISIAALQLTSGGCTAFVDLKIFSLQNVQLRHGPKMYVEIVILEEGNLVKGPKNYVVNSVIKYIENFAKKFAIQWTIDNR